MKKLKLTGKYMRALGYPEGPVISIAMNIIAKEFKKAKDGEIEFILLSILQNPEAYIDHRVLGKIAVKLLPPISKEIQLKDKGIEFAIFGKEHIEQGAIHQMHIASKLPIAQKGALMPDAHSGYGLPIGGVLATKNTVIPYGVGVDIGCRMSLSILDISLDYFEKNKDIFISELNKSTLFGSGAEFQRSSDHPILGNDTFNQVQILKNLHGKAWKQLGSSGSGNHFVEFGEVQINVQDEVLLVPPGRYLGLLSHSGSRGLGASIAQHYTKIAKDQCQLPGEAKNLAWLDLGSDDGLEYWLAMNLAGDYASACHEVIHKKIIASLRCQVIGKVENHHNFAWKELIDGEEWIVHRKGATPAGPNILGIIPGSMTEPGYIVKGRGNGSSLNSASHGAGRKMSRTVAKQSITKKMLHDELAQKKVTLVGGDLDEAPFAYKNIAEVMASQKELVDVLGQFWPRVVRMDG